MILKLDQNLTLELKQESLNFSLEHANLQEKRVQIYQKQKH